MFGSDLKYLGFHFRSGKNNTLFLNRRQILDGDFPMPPKRASWHKDEMEDLENIVVDWRRLGHWQIVADALYEKRKKAADDVNEILSTLGKWDRRPDPIRPTKRTPMEVMNKFIEMLNPNQVRLTRHFTKEEDKLLRCLNEEGNQLRGKFSQMVKFFKFRSETVLRQRTEWLMQIEGFDTDTDLGDEDVGEYEFERKKEKKSHCTLRGKRPQHDPNDE
jgi:hypothetical protein